MTDILVAIIRLIYMNFSWATTLGVASVNTGFGDRYSPVRRGARSHRIPAISGLRERSCHAKEHAGRGYWQYRKYRRGPGQRYGPPTPRREYARKSRLLRPLRAPPHAHRTRGLDALSVLSPNGPAPPGDGPMTSECPECGTDDLHPEGGCPFCPRCGWSKCG